MTALIVAAIIGVPALAYAAAWAAIGHEPLLRRNCHCIGRRRP